MGRESILRDISRAKVKIKKIILHLSRPQLIRLNFNENNLSSETINTERTILNTANV